MISFRFHLVSIVAVFLALAIGIVVGSTLIDRAIVEGLRNRVDEVSDNLDVRQAENDRLNDQLDEMNDFATDAAPITVDDRMEGTVIVVVKDAGVENGPVNRTIELLRRAGSGVRGVLTLNESWLLEDAELRDDVAEVVGSEPDLAPEELRDRAAELLVADLSSEVVVVGDETGAVDLMSDLEVVDYEEVEDVELTRPRDLLFLVVSGPTSDLGGSDHTEAFASSAVEVAGGAVVAEVWREDEEGPDRADSLAAILGSPTLSATITTVDNLDQVQGPTVAVLALLATHAGDVGHYGVGDGAEAAAPPAPPT